MIACRDAIGRHRVTRESSTPRSWPAGRSTAPWRIDRERCPYPDHDGRPVRRDLVALDSRVHFSSAVAVDLLCVGVRAHAGGLVPVGSGLLYNTSLGEPDRSGTTGWSTPWRFGTAAIACWQGLCAALGSRPDVGPGLAALGGADGRWAVGAVNEVGGVSGRATRSRRTWPAIRTPAGTWWRTSSVARSQRSKCLSSPTCGPRPDRPLLTCGYRAPTRRATWNRLSACCCGSIMNDARDADLALPVGVDVVVGPARAIGRS